MKIIIILVLSLLVSSSALAIGLTEQEITHTYHQALEGASQTEAKLIKKHQERVMKVLRKLTRKDSGYKNYVLSNGLTTQETFLRVQTREVQSTFLKVFTQAMEEHQQALKENKPSDFQTHLQNEIDKGVLHKSLPHFGLVLYSCVNDGSTMHSFTMHLVVFGRMGCDWIEELTVGPGLMVVAREAQAYFCIGTDDGFKGIGVTAGASLGAGIEIGTYVGAYGVCIKVASNAPSFGARAGISYINIDQDGSRLNLKGE